MYVNKDHVKYSMPMEVLCLLNHEPTPEYLVRHDLGCTGHALTKALTALRMPMSPELPAINVRRTQEMVDGSVMQCLTVDTLAQGTAALLAEKYWDEVYAGVQ